MESEPESTPVLTYNQAKWLKVVLMVVAALVTLGAIVTHYMTGISPTRLEESNSEIISVKEKHVRGLRGTAGRRQIVIELANRRTYYCDDDRDSIFDTFKSLKKGDEVRIIHATWLQSVLSGAGDLEILQLERGGRMIYSLDTAQERLGSLRNNGLIVAAGLWLVVWGLSKVKKDLVLKDV